MLRLRVKEVAREKGLSLTKLSQRSEVSYNIVKGVFRDPYRVITTYTLQKLAKALGVSALELLEEVPDKDGVDEEA